jgi:hypothetical protein
VVAQIAHRQELFMYRVGDYFVECFTRMIGHGGWVATVKFTPRADYMRPSEIRQAMFDVPAVLTSRAAAERAGLMWAHRFAERDAKRLEEAILATDVFHR